MNSRQLTLILVLALVLSAAGWIIFHQSARSWESQPTAGNEKVVEFPLNDVAHLRIKDATGEVNLVRKADVWVVRERADYPANFEQVSRFLQKLWNLKPVQTLQVGPSQLARFDLIAPDKDAKNSGTLLELKDKDGKAVATILAGKQYLKKSNQSAGPPEFPAGRYVMPGNDAKRVALVSDTLQDLVTKPERWLSRDFIRIEKPKTFALAGATPEKQWKIVRENETAEWKFADPKAGQELDQSKAAPLASSVSSLSFTDVLDPQTNLENPSTATIETVDGFTYTLKIGQLKGETYPVTVAVESQPIPPATPAPNEKPDEQKKSPAEKLAQEKKFEGRPFLVNKVTVEQILKNRSDLVKTEPSPTPAAPVTPPKLPSPAPKARP